MKGTRYALTLESTGEAPTLPGLRRLLKALGRRYGLRVVTITPDQKQGDNVHQCSIGTYGGGLKVQ